MAFGRTTVRLALVAALLVSAGCASRGGRMPLARLKPGGRTTTAARRSDEVLPKYDKNQLLAAARLYEKQGHSDQAALMYRQVLAVDPDNAEARQGVQVVQSGELRQDQTIKDLIAASQQSASPGPQSAYEPQGVRDEMNVEMAHLLTEAVAQRETILSDEGASTVVPVSASTMTTDEPAGEFAVCALSATDSSSPGTYPRSPRASRPVKRPYGPTLADLLDKSDESEFFDTPEHLPVVEPASVTPIAETEVTLNVIDESELANPADWADDSNWKPRAVTNLCQDANAAVLREVAMLDSADASIRKEGLWSLAEMGTDAMSAADAVKVLLNDPNEIVRAHAAWATWELTDDANIAAPALAELINSSDTDVVQFAAFTLSGMGTQAQTAIPALRQQLKNKDSLIRLHVAEALSKVGAEADRVSAIHALISLTAEGGANVRVLSLMALGDATTTPTPEAATAITQALHDADAEVRSAAALTLGSFGQAAESAIAQLEFVAQNDEKSVRDAATTAIACIRK